MQTDINNPYPLSTHVDEDVVNKNHNSYMWIRMRIAVLRYADVIINRIRIPFIYNKFTKTTSF
jgi:hypothetical protein